MPKYHLVFFFSEGQPKDKGLNLSKNKDIIINSAKKHFDNISWYTPSILKKMGYGWYVKERPKGLMKKNKGMNNIGNCSWRPLIMMLELKKMNKGDILVYRDCNVKKRKGLEKYDNIKKIINECLNISKFDFFVPRETRFIPQYKFTKTNVLKTLGQNHPFTYNYPNIFSGLLTIARKSEISLELIGEWKKACEVEEWINGKQYGSLHKGFLWQCPEQSILGVIISNWIRKKKHNISKHYPNITFRNAEINRMIIYKNFQYLKYLSS